MAYSRTLSLYLFQTTDQNCEIPFHSRNPELQVCLSAVMPFGFTMDFAASDFTG